MKPSTRSRGFGRKMQKSSVPYSQLTGIPLYKQATGRAHWDSIALCRTTSPWRFWSLVLTTAACISVRWRSGFILSALGGEMLPRRSQETWTLLFTQTVRTCHYGTTDSVLHLWCLSLFFCFYAGNSQAVADHMSAVFPAAFAVTVIVLLVVILVLALKMCKNKNSAGNKSGMSLWTEQHPLNDKST